MPRLCSAWRQCAKSYPLSACSLAGRFLGLPMHCRTGGTASISGSRSLLSCRFAFVRRRASGIPLPSTRRCRLLPDLPRSVGFGPIASPPFSPQTMRCRLQPGSSRWRSPYPGGRAAHGAAAPRPQQLANRASAASRSCRSRSPSPWANRPIDRQQTVDPIRKAGAASRPQRTDAGAQHEHDAFQYLAIVNRWTTTLGPRRPHRQEWLDQPPELVGNQRRLPRNPGLGRAAVIRSW
jgi:hypothetical protein